MAEGNFGGGNGEIQSPYLIEDADDFYEIRQHPHSFYRLTTSINLMESSKLGPNGWSPFAFSGVLEGNGYSIKNLKHQSNNLNSVGLFSYLRGVVRNLELSGFDVSGYYIVGALAGSIEQVPGAVAVENVAVKDSILKSTGTNVGGLAGALYGGEIKNSYSKANVQGIGDNKGGLIGGVLTPASSDAAVIENCYCTGLVTGASGTSGGLVGRAPYKQPIVINSFFSTSVGGNNDIGTAKTPAEMLLAVTYEGWEEPMANHVQKVWAIADGSTPELYFNAGSRFLIFAEGKYYKLVGEDWVEMGDTLPTDIEFAGYGLSEGDLAGVPGYVWNKLRIHRAIEMVNLRERYRVEQVYGHKVLENLGQTTDGFLLKTSINLDDYGDTLGRVYFRY